MLQTQRPVSCYNKCCNKTSLISNNNKSSSNKNLELERTKSGPAVVSRQREAQLIPKPVTIPKWLYKVPDETYIQPITNVETKKESQSRHSTESTRTNISSKTTQTRAPSIASTIKSSKNETRVESTKPSRAPTPTPVQAVDKRVRSLEKILDHLKFFRRNPTRQKVYYNYVKRYETKTDNIAEILRHNCYTQQPQPTIKQQQQQPHNNNASSSHKFYTNTWRLFFDCNDDEIGSINSSINRSRNNEVIGIDHHVNSSKQHNKQINLTPASTIVAYRQEIK